MTTWEPSEPIRVTAEQWAQLERVGHLVVVDDVTATDDVVVIRTFFSSTGVHDEGVASALAMVGDHLLDSQQLHALAALVDELADTLEAQGD